jgi:hypothetical protein
MERVLVFGLWSMDIHEQNGKPVASILFQVRECLQRRVVIERNVHSNLLVLRQERL